MSIYRRLMTCNTPRVIVFILFAHVSLIFGQEIDRSSASAVFTYLQNSYQQDGNVLIKQDELDFLIQKDGGGACPSAAAVIVLQGLRIMSDVEPLGSPHKASLKSFRDLPTLLNGRVSNDLFCELIRSYDQYLPDRKVGVTATSAPDSNYAAGNERWSSDEGPNWSAQPHHVKVISFSVDDTAKGRVGRHFVILKELKDDEIFVVDPSNPSANHSYRIEYRQGESHPRYSTLLRMPAGKSVEHLTFTLNTIFDISIEESDSISTTYPSETRSVEQVKNGITHIANKYRDTEQFHDPRAWRKESSSFGLPGLDLPKEYGGSDWKAVDMIEIFRHAGRYDLNFRDVVGGGHGRALRDTGHPEIDAVVKKVVSGDEYVAIAITEPEVGSNVAGIKSTCRKVEGGFLLTGSKRYNARLEQAGHVIIFTQGSSGEQGKLSVFLVPTNDPGLKIEHLTAHGLSGNSYGGLEFKDLLSKIAS